MKTTIEKIITVAKVYNESVSNMTRFENVLPMCKDEYAERYIKVIENEKFCQAEYIRDIKNLAASL